MARKKLPVWEGVEVIDLDVKGRGVVKHDSHVAFVKDTIPGDIVDIKVVKKKKGFMEAIPLRMVKKSPDSIDPFCKHFDECGGCKLQNLSYEKQLAFKSKLVGDAFQRIAKVPIGESKPIMGCDKTSLYRNKLNFSFSNKRWITRKEADSENDIDKTRALGFHVAMRFDKVLHVEKCHLQPEPVNEIRNEVFNFCVEHNISFYDLVEHKGIMRTLVLRDNGDGEFMAIIVIGEDKPEAIQELAEHLNEKFEALTSIHLMVNLKLNDSLFDQIPIKLFGKDALNMPIGHLNFNMGPKSFMQTNTDQTLNLYNAVRDAAELTGNEVVYDLFCGVGTIGMFVANQAKEVIGIETIDEAVEMANENMELNGIENAQFLAGSCESILTDEFANKYPGPDVVITDPPRDGMHKNVVKMLLKLAPRRIVYVSCNPSTQARDVAMLDELYEVKSVQPVDMFPQTPHVESIAVLDLKK